MKVYPKNKSKFQKMAEEATVDYYDEYEQYGGWACTLEEELPLPLKCLVFGEEATLINVDTDDNGTSVLGIVSKNKKKIRIPIQDIEVVNKKDKKLE